jgi:hypothetical protein
MQWLARLPTYLAVATLAGAFAPASPSAADWLVLGDGSTLETDGPWRLEGAQVVFTLRGGGLAALPADEVNLEASRHRSEPAAAAPAPRARARWTITDADVARSLDVDEEGGGGSAEHGTPEQRSSLTGVSVASWEETAPPDLGIALAGTLRNDGNDYAASLRVEVELRDDSGDLIERRSVVPARSMLAPGESTEFTVEFPDVVGFSDVRFVIQGRGYAAAPAPPRAAASAEEPPIETPVAGEPEEEGLAAEEAFAEEAPAEEPPSDFPEGIDETYGEGIEEEVPGA